MNEKLDAENLICCCIWSGSFAFLLNAKAVNKMSTSIFTFRTEINLHAVLFENLKCDSLALAVKGKRKLTTIYSCFPNHVFFSCYFSLSVLFILDDAQWLIEYTYLLILHETLHVIYNQPRIFLGTFLNDSNFTIYEQTSNTDNVSLIFYQSISLNWTFYYPHVLNL